MERKILMLVVANGFVVALMLLINWMFLRQTEMIFNLINFFAFFVFAFPIMVYYYVRWAKYKQIESMFSVFLRDFVENVRGGLTLPQAFKAVSSNDYKELTPYIKKMAAQLDWGIPVEDVLINFAKEVKSKNISRIVYSVIESHKFGGNLADTFQALANVAAEIEKLRKERFAYLQSQLITGYIIFFVFIGVMIGMERFLVPSISKAGTIETLAKQASPADIANEFKVLFRDLILIQGLFAGMAVGKMSEGSIIGGLKHSFFMMFVGGLVFTLVG